MAALSFDAYSVVPAVFSGIMPAGEYKAAIVDSEMKLTKDGSGQYLELKFEILEGEYKNWNVWDRLNIENRNQKAQDIAQQNLSAICHAINVFKLTDSSQLHHKPLVIKVAAIPPKNGYDEKNEIKKYKPLVPSSTRPRPAIHSPVATAPSAAPQQVAPQQAASQSVAIASSKSPPWRRGPRVADAIKYEAQADDPIDADISF